MYINMFVQFGGDLCTISRKIEFCRQCELDFLANKLQNLAVLKELAYI